MRISDWSNFPSTNAAVITGILKAKLSKLRRELLDAGSGGKRGGGAGERGFEVSKAGDTRVGLVGEICHLDSFDFIQHNHL